MREKKTRLMTSISSEDIVILKIYLEKGVRKRGEKQGSKNRGWNRCSVNITNSVRNERIMNKNQETITLIYIFC